MSGAETFASQVGRSRGDQTRSEEISGDVGSGDLCEPGGEIRGRSDLCERGAAELGLRQLVGELARMRRVESGTREEVGDGRGQRGRRVVGDAQLKRVAAAVPGEGRVREGGEGRVREGGVGRWE